MNRTIRRWGLISSALVLCLSSSSLALAAPGDLDPHFGERGLRTINMGDYDHMVDMALDGSKIVAVGRVFFWDDLSNDLALARFMADGRPDPSFGSNGVVTTDLGNKQDLPGAVAVLPDGGYLVAASTASDDNPWDRDLVLVRYTNTGEIDTTFGTNGVHRFDVFSIDDVAAMEIQPDGKILLAGRSGGPTYTFMVVRLHPDGSFDTDSDADPTVHFSTDGKAFPDATGYNQRAHDMELQPDGKILIAGASGVNENGDMAMTRLNNDGSVDTDFGNNGFVHVDESSTEWFNDLALQPDGRIVAVGGSYVGEQGLRGIVVRYTASGDEDTTFGDAGFIQGPTGDASYSDGAAAVVIQPNGRIVVLGKVSEGSLDAAYLMRLVPSNGAPDPTFGNWKPGFSRFATPKPHAQADILMSGNRVIVGGQTSDEASDFYAQAIVAKMAPSKTTVQTGKKAAKILVRGSVSPKHAGKKVKLLLQKKKGGRFVNVARQKVALNVKSVYRTTFKRPDAEKCRVVATFVGDAAHNPSTAKTTFAC